MIEIIRFTLIPINAEAPLSSLQARIALPVFVLLINKVNAIIITIQVKIVINVKYGMLKLPSLTEPFKIVGKIFVSVPQINIAAFCKK